MSKIETKNLIVKEKDYDYYEKSRKIKLVQSNANPLIYTLEERQQKVEQKLNQDTNDKLTDSKLDVASSNLMQSTNDPLSRKPNPLATLPTTFNPLKPGTKILQFKSESPVKVQEPKQEEIKVEPAQIEQSLPKSHKKVDFFDLQYKTLWVKFREEFVKCYDSNRARLDGFIVNPFPNIEQIFKEDKNVIKVVPLSKQPNYEVEEQSRFFSQPSPQPQQQTSQSSSNEMKIQKKLYLVTIDKFQKELKDFWNVEHKIEALKVAVKACKLLSDNEDPDFYAMKFVRVMDVVETTGQLILERMKKLAFPKVSKDKLAELQEQNFQPNTIPETAKEIARNWISTIAKIKEVIPRLLLESSVLKLYYYFDPEKIPVQLQRLATFTNSLGDVQLQAYYGCYVIRIGEELQLTTKDYLLKILSSIVPKIKVGGKFWLKSLSQEETWTLYKPMFNNLLRNYSENCDIPLFQKLLQIYSLGTQNQQLMIYIIETFQEQIISKNAMQIIQKIEPYQLETKYKIYSVFLPKLSKFPPEKRNCEELTKIIWDDISKIQKFSSFLDISAQLIELVYRSFPRFIRHEMFIKMLTKFNEFFNQIASSTSEKNEIWERLEDFIKKILGGCDDISEIVSLEPFLNFMQYFPEKMKQQVSRNVLSLFITKQTQTQISDPMSVHFLLEIAKTMNNEEKEALEEDQAKQITLVINKFLEKINFGKDLEQTLNFHTEIRSNFDNIPEIIENLVIKTLQLTFKAKQYAKGNVTKKIIGFMQACIAYCFITISTIQDPFLQLKCYSLTSTVALLHNMISQSESLFKLAVQVLSEIINPLNEENANLVANNILKNLIGVLFVLPENPESDYLTTYQGFIGAIQQLKWEKKFGYVQQMNIYMDLMAYLCAQLQEKLPYHITNVKSNDFLYAENDFKNAVYTELNQLLNLIQNQIQKISELNFSQKEKSNVCKECIHWIYQILSYFNPNERVLALLRKICYLLKNKFLDIDPLQRQPEFVTEIKNVFQVLLKQNQDTEIHEIKNAMQI